MVAAVLFNLAGDDAQFARSRCSISGGILRSNIYPEKYYCQTLV
jgi:hypothetical protein